MRRVFSSFQHLCASVREHWMNYPIFGALTLWSLSIIVYTYIIAGPVFPDPDSFYHIKITELIAHQKSAITQFPWLAFTSLTQSYVDHHFLYHVFLIPWIVIFGNITGAKIATVVLASTTISLLYIVLRTYRVQGSFFFALLLLCNPDFSFRMSLTKATTIGYIYMILGLLLLFKRNYRLLGMLAFGFVWSYGGFILLSVLACITIIVRTILIIIHTHRLPSITAVKLLALPLLSVIAGTIAGLLIHPSFPYHFKFYWEQVIQIGFVNYSNVIGVGGEWYPYQFTDLAGSMVVLSILYLCSIGFAIWHASKLTERSWITLIMSVFFLLFTLKSRRYIEYAVPWAILASAFILNESRVLDKVSQMIHKVQNRWTDMSIISRVIAATGLFGIMLNTGYMMNAEIKNVHKDMQSGFQTTLFTDAGSWLQKHATSGDIVFHDDWSTFPILFYHAAKPYYIVGLDTTFMYRYNPELYWTWANITLNRYDGDLYTAIAQNFHARFVFVDHNHAILRNRLNADSRFVRVYQDDEATIFRIPRK